VAPPAVTQPVVPPRLRFLIALACGLLAGLISHFRASTQPNPRDLAVVWVAARAIISADPYAVAAQTFVRCPGCSPGRRGSRSPTIRRAGRGF
jgi:hypothetical protein